MFMLMFVDQLNHILINMWLDEFMEIIKDANIGNDAVTVYIIRYMLAWIRSGWYPHIIIIIIVGTKDASNHT